MCCFRDKKTGTRHPKGCRVPVFSVLSARGSSRDGDGLHGQLAVTAVHHQGVALLHLAGDDPAADEGLHRVLEIPTQGPGAVDGIVGAVDDVLLGPVGQVHGELLVAQTPV